jgi:hypothetical protein
MPLPLWVIHLGGTDHSRIYPTDVISGYDAFRGVQMATDVISGVQMAQLTTTVVLDGSGSGTRE